MQVVGTILCLLTTHKLGLHSNAIPICIHSGPCWTLALTRLLVQHFWRKTTQGTLTPTLLSYKYLIGWAAVGLTASTHSWLKQGWGFSGYSQLLMSSCRLKHRCLFSHTLTWSPVTEAFWVFTIGARSSACTGFGRGDVSTLLAATFLVILIEYFLLTLVIPGVFLKIVGPYIHTSTFHGCAASIAR